jgi:hypothetical protein
MHFRDLTGGALPPGDPLIEVAYSSPQLQGRARGHRRGRIVRRFPMVCGIDLSGRVLVRKPTP